MMTTVVCPSANQLSMLVSGLLPEPPAEDVFAHVSQCEACARMLAVMPAKDELASSVRRAARVRIPEEQRVRKLRDHLRKIPDKLATRSASDDQTAMIDRPKAKIEHELNLYLNPPEMSDEIGRLGAYRILKVLGRGGMGLVLLAEDVALRRKVALKLMQSHLLADPDIAARFQREARATAAVRSDHVVSIFSVEEIKSPSGPVQCMSMEYLQGESLDSRLKKGPLSVEETLRFGAQIASGLAAVHECGLVHRDIKPGNLWLEPVTGPDGTTTRAKLLDFGLAHAGLEVSVLTAFGTVIGTPSYMSPEQASGKEVDARSDLFSLGAVMYEMLTGRKPFRGPNTMAVLMALAGETPPSPSELSQAIPQPLSDFVMRLLQKSPSARPMTALAVVEQLRSLRKELRGRAPASKLRPSEPVPANEPPAKPAQPVTRAKPTKPTPSRTPDNANATPHITADEPAKPTSAKPAKPTATPREKVATKPRAIPPTLVRLIATVLAGGLVIWLGALLLRVQTPHGTLVIESEDENVEVRVKRNGATIIDHTKNRKLQLEVGEYGIELVNKIDGLKLSAEKITITREGQPPIRVTRISSGDGNSLVNGSIAQDSTSVPNWVQTQTENFALKLREGFVQLPTFPITERDAWTIELTISRASDGRYDEETILAVHDEARRSAACCIRIWGDDCVFGVRQVEGFSDLRARPETRISVKKEQPLQLAISFDGRSQRMFCNGVSQGEVHVANPVVSSGPLFLGSPSSLFNSNFFFRGWIDEVRVSKGVRYQDSYTPARRLEADSQTLALYHFDEGRGDTVYDLSGNRRHGRIHNAEWIKLAEPVPRPNKTDAISPTHRFAKWAFSRGAAIAGPDGQWIQSVEQLPDAAKVLVHVDFSKNDSKFPPLTDADVEGFADLPDVGQHLSFRHQRITDDGLRKLAQVTKDRRLGGIDLVDMPVRLSSLREPFGFATIHNLILINTKTANEDLVLLENFPGLDTLQIRSHPNITDDALQHLKYVPELGELMLDNTGITDAGLTHIVQLKKLRHVRVDGTRVTADGLRRLQLALPNCKVYPAPTSDFMAIPPKYPEDEEPGFVPLVSPKYGTGGWGYPGGGIHREGHLLEYRMGNGEPWGVYTYGGHGELDDFELRGSIRIEGSDTTSRLNFRGSGNRRQSSIFSFVLGGGDVGDLWCSTNEMRDVVASIPKALLREMEPGIWFDLRIRCEGPRTQIWINQKPGIDYLEKRPGICERGVLCFRSDVPNPKDIPLRRTQFANLRIKQLGSHAIERVIPASWRIGDNPAFIEINNRLPFPPITAPPLSQQDTADSLPLGEWVDLLPWVRRSLNWSVVCPEPHRWEFENNDLFMPDYKPSRFILPVTIEGNYSMEVELTRQQGGHQFSDVVIGFPLDDQNVFLALSAHDNTLDGILDINGKLARDNGTARMPSFLKDGQRHRVTIEVEQDGDRATFHVHVDEKRDYIVWGGSKKSFTSRMPRHWQPYSIHHPFLGGWSSSVLFHSLRLKMVSGNARRTIRTRDDMARDRASGFVRLIDLPPTERPQSGPPGFAVNRLALESPIEFPRSPRPEEVNQAANENALPRCNDYYVCDAPSRLTCDVPEGAKSFSVIANSIASKRVNFMVAANGVTLFEGLGRDQNIVCVDLPEGTRSVDLTTQAEEPQMSHCFWMLPRFHNVQAARVTNAMLDAVPDEVSIHRARLESLTIVINRGPELRHNDLPETLHPIHPLKNSHCHEFITTGADSTVHYDLPEGAKRFTAIACNPLAWKPELNSDELLRAVQFRVLADDKLLYESTPAGIVAIDVSVPVKARRLTLQIIGSVGATEHGVGIWCYPRIHVVDRREGSDAQSSKSLQHPTSTRASRVALNPQAIPEAERFPWQPKGLVGAIGSHELTHWGPVSSVAANGDGTALLSTGDDGIWIKPTLNHAAVYFHDRINPAEEALWHPKFGFLTVHRDGTVNCWKTSVPIHSEKLWQLPASTRLLRISDEGETLVAWIVSGTKLADLLVRPHPVGEVIVYRNRDEKLVEQIRFAAMGPPALSPAGRWLTVHNLREKQIERRDLQANDAPLVVAQDCESPACHLATPSEDRLIVQTLEHRLQLWRVTDGVFQQLDSQALTGDSNDYCGIHTAKNGARFVLLRNANTELEVIDIVEDQFKPFVLLRSEANAGTISRNGMLLVGAGNSGNVRFHQLADGKFVPNPVRDYELLSERYSSLSSGPNLMSAGDGSMIGIVHSALRGERWSLRGPIPEKLPPPVGDDPYQRPVSAISDDGTLALVPGLRMERDLWRVTDGAQSATALPDQLQAMRAGFSDDGRLIAATTRGELVIYDVSTRLVEKRAQSESLGEQTTVWSVAFQRGTSRVVAITHPTTQRRELTLRVFDVQDKTIRELYSKSLSNVSVALSRHGHHLAVAYPDGIVEHYEIQSAILKKRGEVKLASPAVALDISATGDRLLTSGPEHEVRIWNTADGKLERLWQFPGRVCEAIFAGSEHVLTANANMTAYVLKIVP